MKRLVLILAVLCLGSSGMSGTARAQFADPFFMYYSYFVPQQAALASVPKQEDNLRILGMQRQMTAQTNRDVLGELNLGGYDPLSPFGGPGAAGGGANKSRLPRVASTGPISTHVNGSGPQGYYNRTNTHFPGRRVGQTKASTNIVGTRGKIGGMGGGAMGGMMGGMGGMGGFG